MTRKVGLSFLLSAMLAITLSLLSSAAYAVSCPVEADKLKLTGAARTTFMKKCEVDSKIPCDKFEAVTDYKRTKSKPPWCQ